MSGVPTPYAKVAHDAAHDSELTSLDRRLARTMTSRARAAGRASVFVAADELRALLASPDVEAIEVCQHEGRVLAGVRVADLERRLAELDPRP